MEKVAFSKSIIQNTEIICRAIENREFTLIDELLECPELPAVYKNMISAERDAWILREKLRLEANPCFNFKIRTNLCFEFENLLKNISVIPFGDFKSFIETFVKLRLNFLLRPRTTLKFFVFRESLTVSFEQLLKYLAYFSDYEYIYQGFYDYIAQQTEKNRDIITIYEFESLLEKIDNDFILNLDENEFINLLQPIFEFFTVNLETVPQAPSSAFIIFFTDKKLNYIAYLIENSFKNTNITQGELLDILKTNLMSIQTEELTSKINIASELATEFEEEAAAEIFDVQEEIEENTNNNFFQEEIEDVLNSDIDFKSPDIDKFDTADNEEMLIEVGITEEFAQEETFESNLEDIIDEGNKLEAVFEEAKETNYELNDTYEELVEEQIDAFEQGEFIQSNDFQAEISSNEMEITTSENDLLGTNATEDSLISIDEDLMEYEDISFSDAVKDIDEQIEMQPVAEIPEILQEEIQKLDQIEPNTEEQLQEIYDIERNIIQKACELIAGNIETSVELPIEIENIEEFPVFENAGDLSSSLTNFLAKVMNEDTENSEIDNQVAEYDISNESNGNTELTESELISDFATSDFDSIESDNEDFESEIKSFEVKAEETNTAYKEYELDETTGELVENQNVNENEKVAREILNFNEELLEKMKYSKNKINLSEEEIDIDLLLLNKKEDENEVR